MRRIVLVSCGKAKSEESRPARELYTGNLFRAARDYAEASGCEWFILSGKHGLVEPATELAPYDERVPGAAVRLAVWGADVIAELERRFPGEELELEVLAGVMYALPLRDRAESKGWAVVEPLQGLEVGERLRWFKQRREAAAALVAKIVPAASCEGCDDACRFCPAMPDTDARQTFTGRRAERVAASPLPGVDCCAIQDDGRNGVCGHRSQYVVELEAARGAIATACWRHAERHNRNLDGVKGARRVRWLTMSAVGVHFHADFARPIEAALARAREDLRLATRAAARAAARAVPGQLQLALS